MKLAAATSGSRVGSRLSRRSKRATSSGIREHWPVLDCFSCFHAFHGVQLSLHVCVYLCVTCQVCVCVCVAWLVEVIEVLSI